MAIKAKLSLLLFFFGSFLLSFTSSLAYEKDNNADPRREYEMCMSRCQQEGPRQQCLQHCREYQLCITRCQQQEGSQQQCQRLCEQEREERRGGDNINADRKREYKLCMRRCQQQGGSQQQQECEQRCKEILGEQEREEQRGEDHNADPQREFQRCMRSCLPEEGSRQQKQQCRQRCQEYQLCIRSCERQGGSQQQCQRRCEQEREERRGGDNINADREKEYERCMRRCQQQRGEDEQCQESCEEILRDHERDEGRRQQQQESNNPYFFDEQSFIEKYKTEEGRIRILPKFTQRSNLHRGIENYRLEIFEANPNTFVIPNHCDADAVIYVVKGRMTISMIYRRDKRDSFNLERGDVIRVSSGSVVYMVNRDNNEQLQIAKLYLPISKTGHFNEFFGVGGLDPESFYRTFSNEVLEATFDISIDVLERLFGQQRKGVIIKATKEQVQVLSKQASRGPYNMLNKRPMYSNNYGKLYEVKPDNYEQLQDLDIAVSFVNITKGAMMAPYYNTRATKLILVVEGRGRFEMAVEEEEQEKGGAHYQRVNASLSPKTMFIVPTGHPVTIIASDNENLQLVEFTINFQDSQRNFLAGKENVVNQMENEAKELGFNIPSGEVNVIYDGQKESVFVPGPNDASSRGKEEATGYPFWIS